MIQQIAPNHADNIFSYNSDFLEKMFKLEACIAQPKYDGQRMLIHFDNGNAYATSRRISKKTGKYMELQDRLPKLSTVASILSQLGFGYIVLDCECYAKNWSEIMSILRSLPDRAIELQNTINAKFAVFDCLVINGEDIRNLPYIERLEYLKLLFDQLTAIPEAKDIHICEFMLKNNLHGNIKNCCEVTSLAHSELLRDSAIASGFEGICIKSLTRSYYDKAATLKCKQLETLDCVVIGYELGNGKYSTTVGKLKLGYYDKENDEFVYISKCNCGTDSDRNMWLENWDALKYSVLEIDCQEVTEKSIRNPVYKRIREDKDYTMCTRETIFKE